MSKPKRSFSDFKAESSEDGQLGSQEKAFREHTTKRQKNKQGSKAAPPPKNLNETKKRARNIERRLRIAENLPADIRVNLERELVHLKLKIDDGQEEKKTKKMISKYHMIRFYADRLAKQIEKQIQSTEDPEEIKQLKQDLHTAQIDSLYAKFFPLREKYISLYSAAVSNPDAKEDEETASGNAAAKSLKAEKPKLWGVIEKAAKKGVPALNELRNRKLSNDSRSKAPKERPSKHSFAAKAQVMAAKNPLVKGPRTTKAGDGRMELKNPGQKPKRKVEDSSDDGDDSDGGFFEAA
ncbi:hypothetical protein TruAng_000097 [Truncatella angustata]|nr:hypothetical protein TruAng_000097 [Truncatella angustata]